MTAAKRHMIHSSYPTLSVREIATAIRLPISVVTEELRESMMHCGGWCTGSIKEAVSMLRELGADIPMHVDGIGWITLPEHQTLNHKEKS